MNTDSIETERTTQQWLNSADIQINKPELEANSARINKVQKLHYPAIQLSKSATQGLGLHIKTEQTQLKLSSNNRNVAIDNSTQDTTKRSNSVNEIDKRDMK